MKLTTLAVAALLPFAALGAPTGPDDAAPSVGAVPGLVERDAEAWIMERDAEAEIMEREADAEIMEREADAEILERDAETGLIEKRSVSGTVRVDGLRYRKCPRTSCTAVGQYKKGTHVRLSCYTRKNTTTVKGDK